MLPFPDGRAAAFLPPVGQGMAASAGPFSLQRNAVAWLTNYSLENVRMSCNLNLN